MSPELNDLRATLESIEVEARLAAALCAALQPAETFILLAEEAHAALYRTAVPPPPTSRDYPPGTVARAAMEAYEAIQRRDERKRELAHAQMLTHEWPSA